MKISAKNLGEMALDDFCPRCFYLKNKYAIPFQWFPGIFSSIDAWTKKVAHDFMDKSGVPPWLPDREDIVGWKKSLHWSKFQYTDPATGIILSGVTDDVWTCNDGTDIIPDYKTARYTETQDKLLPMYEVQCNGYAIIHESLGNKVRSTPLIYCEPDTDNPNPEHFLKLDGFTLGFTAKVVPVERNHEMIFELLHKAKNLLEGPIPEETAGCKDCAKMNKIITACTETK